jgi:hypothetical protein
MEQQLPQTAQSRGRSATRKRAPLASPESRWGRMASTPGGPFRTDKAAFEMDAALDLADVGLLRAIRIVFEADGITDLIQ